MQSLSLLSGDCVSEKLEWTFRLYDVNVDGLISKDELLDIVTSIYDLLGDVAVSPDTIQQHAHAVFQVRSQRSPTRTVVKSQLRE